MKLARFELFVVAIKADPSILRLAASGTDGIRVFRHDSGRWQDDADEPVVELALLDRLRTALAQVDLLPTPQQHRPVPGAGAGSGGRHPR